MGPLSGLRVLDIGERISAPYSAKTLANMGAEVIKVEPPRGDEARRMGPFPDETPHPEKSGLFLALNANKYGVTLDITTSEGSAKLRKLAETTDIVVENLPLGYLDGLGLGYEALREVNAGIIVTSITPFGSWGPKRTWKMTDLTLCQMSGYAPTVAGPVEDVDQEPPIRVGGHQAEFAVGVAATTATLMALFRKRMTGEGSHIEASAYETMVTMMISSLAATAYGGPAPNRDREVERQTAMGRVLAVGGLLPCNDGYVAYSPREEAQWQRWLKVLGNPDWATDERFATQDARHENPSELWELQAEWSCQHSMHDIARWGSGGARCLFPGQHGPGPARRRASGSPRLLRRVRSSRCRRLQISRSTLSFPQHAVAA